MKNDGREAQDGFLSRMARPGVVVERLDDDAGLPVFILFETCPIGHLETRIAELRQIFTIVQGASDRFPFTPTVDTLRDVTGGLIMPIQYRGNAALQPVKEPDTHTLVHYSANRTLILDRIHTLVSAGKMVLSGYGNHKETLVAHLTDMVRDEQPDAEAEWKKRTGNDHFFHAMALSLLSRRVCEHIYATGSVTAGASTALVTADWLTSPSGLTPGNGVNRFSRLGA